MSHRSLAFICFTCLLVAAVEARALTYVPVSDGDLVDRSDVIVRAEVASVRVTDETGGVTTAYRFAVLESFKGPDPGAELTVHVPGGIDLDDGLAVKVFGTPEFSTGQTALLFLAARPDHGYRVLHVFQGAFLERIAAGRRVFERPGVEAFAVERVAPLTRSRTERAPLRIRPAERVPRDGALFERWIADRLAGAHRAGDYLMPELPASESRLQPLVSEFTYLIGDDLLIRWFDFDDGDKVGWHRHQDGQEGFSKGGSKEFKKARNAWKKRHSGVPIKLSNRGATSSTTGFTVSDARNTLLHRDFNDSIGEDFDCEEGGVLAIGGLSATDLIPVIWKGLATVAAREAEIVMNDAIDCFLEGDKKAVAQIYAHELGHTLGLGHSCGDSSSPKCSKSEFLADALMVASLDWIFGAELHDDDVLAARQLYDEDFWAAACEKRVPGAKSFCSKCGPCGEGQGNCRNDSDCFGSLVCAKDVGAGFGFDANTDVCTAP
ncbi:MAG: hypothetical protein GY769_05160 [bacterium]|nr:hypothetical protein [bacterium]